MNKNELSKDWCGQWSSLGENLIHSDWKVRSDMTLNDFDSIESLLKTLADRPLKIAEIGTGLGASTAMLAVYAYTTGGMLHTCDPYIDGVPVSGAEKMAESKRRIEELGLSRCVTFHNKTSKEMAAELDTTFDFIFIDGDHEYKSVLEDLRQFFPKLDKYGIIAGHDYEMNTSADGTFEIDTDEIMFDYPGQLLKTNGEVKITDIKGWATMDIVGMLYNGKYKGIHPGVMMAVAQFFCGEANLLGDRIWWYQQ